MKGRLGCGVCLRNTGGDAGVVAVASCEMDTPKRNGDGDCGKQQQSRTPMGSRVEVGCESVSRGKICFPSC